MRAKAIECVISTPHKLDKCITYLLKLYPTSEPAITLKYKDKQNANCIADYRHPQRHYNALITSEILEPVYD